MKVIITGGAGFIGSHLADFFIDLNYEVIVIDNLSVGRLENIAQLNKKKSFVFHEKDISNYESIEYLFEGVDYVFHLAALADIVPSIENPNGYFETNVNGTFNVLEACRKYKIKKIIYSASSSCYGIPDNYPTKEDSEIRPQYPYALTKNLGEQLVMHWNQLYDLPAISLRFFNVYGPRLNLNSQYSAVFGNFLNQKKNKKPLSVVGDGKQTRDFIHVDDLTNAFVKIIRSSHVNKTYNLGSGKETSINKIASIFGGRKTFIPKRPNEPKRSLANISKIKKDIDWRPIISIQEGVKKLLDN